MAFTPLTASAADTVDAPVGTESVLTELSMQDASGTTSPWGGTYVSCWDSEVASWNSDSEVYVKLTVSSVDDYTGSDGSVTSFGDILKWSGLFDWFTFAKIYENQNLNFEYSLIPVTGSTSDCATAYLPFSNIKLQTGDDGVSKGVGFNLQAGNCGFTVDSLELVRVSADRTAYASQNVPLVELTGENKNDMNLPGVFDLSKANGPQARLEITFTTNAGWGGMKLLDATDSANVDYDNPLTMIQGTDVIGQYTKSIKLSDLGSSAKTIWLNTWSVASIDSIVIYNDATKGDIYTIPVVTVAPDTVEVTAAKTAELVGTPVSLEAAVSNANGGEINVDYNVEWTVDPAEGATVTGDKTSAALSATKAGEYTVTCTVKAEDGTTYATDSVKVTFTAPINPIDVTADAKELYTGETTQATATRDGKAVSVTWKSSDEKIATVDEKGVITAVGKGTVTITATPEDGSPASVVIKVKEAGQEQKVEQFVDRLYNTLLGRTPDEHSADHKNDLLADKTACDVARNFVLSEEFLNMGLTNEEVVDKMYMAFLGRPADEAGKADWVNRLNNGCSYAHVFYGFTQCNEFAEICADYGIKVGTYEVESPRDVNCNLTAFVSRLYGKVLGRTYDVPGLDNHTAKYLKTGDIYAMAYDFIFSPEFTKKELTDEEFVELMYNTFFDRDSDPEGKAHWLEVLAGEGTREDVLKGFVGSQECAELVESFKI